MTSRWNIRNLAATAVLLVLAAAPGGGAAGTSVGDGANPPSVGPVCPGAGAATLDAFTLQASGTADSVSRVTVTLAPGTWSSVERLEVTTDADAPLGGAVPWSDSVAVTLSPAIAVPVGGTTQYRVRITPRAHVGMPARAVGVESAVRGTVTAITSSTSATTPVTYGDVASATVTIDNRSPAAPRLVAVTPAANQVALSWQLPPDADLNRVVVLMKQGGPVPDAPLEGSSPTGSVGGSTVVYSGAGTATTVTGLSNGQPYYFAVHARDACGNFSLAATAGPVFPGVSPLAVGDPTPGSTRPVVAILNPARGAVVSLTPAGTFLVQARVASPAAAIGTVQVTSNLGSSWVALTRNSSYGTAATSGVWQVELPLATGSYTLYARATNDGGATWVVSAPVGVTVKPSRTGDGNLLARDNSSQLCLDCHAIASHGSDVTSNARGSWAVVCRDCHTPHRTTNVSLVATEITPPPVGASVALPKKVTFTNRAGSGPGSFVSPDRTGPCQVCHTQTKYYRADGTGDAHDGGNCAACHNHKQGLRAGCTSCHGTEGRAGAPGADALHAAAPPTAADGATDPADPGVGAHQAHVNQASLRPSPIACNECHTMPNAHDGSSDVALSGALARSGGLTPSYAGGSCASTWCHGGGLKGGGNTSPAWTGGASQAACGTCHYVIPRLSAAAAEDHPQNSACADCHGAGFTATTVGATHLDGTRDVPVLDCTACHGNLSTPDGSLPGVAAAAPGYDAASVDTRGRTSATAPLPPSVGAHQAHVNPSASQGLMAAAACSVCHGPLPAVGDVTHANGAIGVGWSAPANAGGVTPTPAAFTAGWEATPSCTNYCHSNAAPATGTNATAAPLWTSTANLTCTSCHAAAGRDTTGVLTDLSQKHGKHLAAGTYNYTCDECHADTVANDSRTAITGPGFHVNGSKSVKFSTTMKTTAVNQSAGTYASGTCSATYCHSNGTTATAPFGAPASALVWTSGVATCGSCHAGGAAMATGSHGPHVSNAATGSYGCQTCHALTTANGTTIASHAWHVNGAKDVTVAVWASASKTCSSNACHFSGNASAPTPYTTVTWGGGAIGCNGCHGKTNVAGAPDYANGGAGTATANSHAKHTASGTALASCQDCHAGFVSAGGTAIVGTSHTNGTKNVAILAAYDTNGATSNYNAGTKTCSSVSCHGSATPVWGGTTACNSCHGTSTPRTAVTGADTNLNAAPPVATTGASATTDPKVGAHVAHVNQLTLRSSALACAECHPSPNVHQGTRDAGWGTLATNAGAVTPSPAAGAGAFTAGWEASPSCSNYCHGSSLTSAGGSHKAPLWTATSAQASCASCHGAPPPVSAVATEDHPQNTNCAACHGVGYVNGGPLGAGAKATHVDRAVQKPANGCTACHGVLAGVAGAAVPNTSPTAAPGYSGTGVDTTGGTLATTVRVGAHDAHVRPAGSLNSVGAMGCATCHPLPAVNDTAHANAAVTMAWPALVSTGGIVVAPAAGTISGTWQATPSCTNYCHSNAAPATGTNATAAPLWTSTANLTCTSCHAAAGRDTTGVLTDLSQKHGKHLAAGTYNYTCDECHADTVANDSRTAITGPGFHVNGSKNVKFSTTMKTTAVNQSAGTYASGTCSATYCHSGGVATAAPFSATASAALAWTTGVSSGCRSCHGWTAAAAPTIGVAAGSSFQGSAKHMNHVSNTAVIGTNYECSDCHAATVSAGSGPVTGFANHVNGVKNVSVKTRGTFVSTEPYTGGSCSATYCHSSGQATPTYRTIAWATGSLGCNGCHGTGNALGRPDYASGAAGSATANSHAKHATSAADCAKCHAQTVNGTGTAIAAGGLHTNGARDVTIAAAFDTNGATSNYNAGTKTCSSVSCHGTGTPVWGGAALRCSDCHLQAALTAGLDSDVDDYVYGNATKANLDRDDWQAYGHGANAAFAESGNPAADFGPNTANANTRDGCMYCHTAATALNGAAPQTSLHGEATNPFRLANANWNGKGKNGVCLVCHDSTSAVGYDPDGSGTAFTLNKLASASSRVNAWHYGSEHTKTGAGMGGQLCWDCHDPHGDRGYGTNDTATTDDVILAYMIQEQPVRTHAAADPNDWGVPTTAELAPTPDFRNNRDGTAGWAWGDYVSNALVPATTGTYRGICQVCHTAAGTDPAANVSHFRQNLYDASHNNTQICTNCHKHTQPAGSEAQAFKPEGSCKGCHGSAVTGTVPRARIVGAASGQEGDDFIRRSRHVSNGTQTEIVTDFDCILCHAEGDVTSNSASVKTVPSLHGADGQAVKTVDLRDVDSSGGAQVAADWPGARKSTPPRAFTTGAMNDRDKMDAFCIGCHDGDGASAVAVNATNSGLDVTTFPTSTSVTRSAGTVTVTTASAHGLAAGDAVYLTIGEANLPPGWKTVATVPTTTTFTYTESGSFTVNSTRPRTFKRYVQTAANGLTRAANSATVTVTTTSAHGLTVGSTVLLFPGELDTSNSGAYVFVPGLKTVATVPNATSFTYAETTTSSPNTAAARTSTVVQRLTRPGVARALTPFNTADNGQNFYEPARTANPNVRQWRIDNRRVLDVKDQFNSANLNGTAFASHHNLNQFTKRYGTVSTTYPQAAAWTTYTTKEGVAINDATNGRDRAGLHCSDCHLNEANAHGTRNSWYMLANSSATDTNADQAFTNAGLPTSTEVCMRCHSASTYGEAGANSTTASRVDAHDGDCSRVDGTTEPGSSAIAWAGATGTTVSGAQQIACLMCHGGLSPGMIHGDNGSYYPVKGTTISKRYRFMGTGGSMRWYSPNSGAYGGEGDWGANTQYTCYTLTAADQFGACTQHNGGRNGNAQNGSRPLSY